jgi:hypothetical protein
MKVRLVAKQPRFSDRDESAPAEGAEGTPGHDSRPSFDTHFLLLEVGKLSNATERLIKDVEKVDNKIDKVSDDIDDLKHGLSFVKGAMWVIGLLVVLVGVVGSLYINGKLSVTLRPGP